MKWELRTIADLTGGELLVGDGALLCGDPVWDSRRVTPGAIFVPLQGERADGHMFIADAQRRGAAASFVRRGWPGELPDGLAVILVDDPLRALQLWAKGYLQTIKAKVVGVTGSIGKTSTKEMIAAALSSTLKVGKTQGNLNTEMGLPAMVLAANHDLDVLVLEMGMRGPGEILELTLVAPPHVAVITNVGVTHIELLGSVENIAQAKGEILQGMRSDGIAVLNGDDPWVREQARRAPGRVIWYSSQPSPGDDVLWADQVQDLGLSMRYVVHWQGEEAVVTIPCPGEHNLPNSLAAIAVGLALGLNMHDCIRGLLNYRPASHRLNVLRAKTGAIVIDDVYNAGPDSVRAALRVLTAYPEGRSRYAVLGDMLELGALAESAHREIGELVASLQLDGLFTVGPLAELMARAAVEQGLQQVKSFTDNDSAAAYLERLLRPDDLVLVKGSRGMQMESIVWALTGEGGEERGH
jgi:UDP-N-acetylmuramoyl-tripeptide--D-alanyl-D-alanine ligase